MHVVPLPWRLGAVSKLTVGATAQTAGPISDGVQAVLVVATADCHIRIGPSAVAVNTDTLIRAGFPPLIFRITQGEQLSVIEDSTGGFLYVTELTH